MGDIIEGKIVTIGGGEIQILKGYGVQLYAQRYPLQPYRNVSTATSVGWAESLKEQSFESFIGVCGIKDWYNGWDGIRLRGTEQQ